MPQHAHGLTRHDGALRQLGGTVDGAVVDHEQLEVTKGLHVERGEEVAQQVTPVAYRHDDRHAWRVDHVRTTDSRASNLARHGPTRRSSRDRTDAFFAGR